MREVIHLHNSGSSLMPTRVVEAMSRHLELEAKIGGYEAAIRAGDRITATYRSIASMLGCKESDIALTESATVAWNRCFLALTAGLGEGDRVLTCQSEYASNYIAMMQLSRRQGVTIDVVPDDSAGSLDVDALERMLDTDVKLVAVTHIPTSGAQVNPAAAIGTVTRRAGIPFLLDACQSAGQMPLNINELKCDALSATGRKYLRGPRGTGFLYINEALANAIEPPDLDLHGAWWSESDGYSVCAGARRFEYFEKNVAGHVGLGVAVDYANALGLDAIQQRVTMLGDYLRETLDANPDVTLTDIGSTRCGIVTFTHARHQPEYVAGRLRAEGINVGTSEQRSTRLDLEARGIKELVRAPVHYFNTTEELDTAAAAIAAL